MNSSKLGVLIGAALLTSAAQAIIIITPGPGNFEGDENILFNEPGLLNNGPVIQGITNQSRFIVDFFDAGEDLISPSGGQARVEAVDGGFHNMTMQMHEAGMVFHTLIWNINAVEAGTVTFRVGRTGGAPHVETFNLVQGGQNFFRFSALGESMIWVRFESVPEVSDVKQIRIGGIVPEPASVIALTVASLGLLSRRRKKK